MLPRVVGNNVEATSGNAEPWTSISRAVGTPKPWGCSGQTGALGESRSSPPKGSDSGSPFSGYLSLPSSLEVVEGELPCSEEQIEF